MINGFEKLLYRIVSVNAIFTKENYIILNFIVLKAKTIIQFGEKSDFFFILFNQEAPYLFSVGNLKCPGLA